MPNMEDFKTFIPWMMEPALQSDFAALPLIADVHNQQAHFKTMQMCFDAWADEEESPARGLTWDQVLLAMTWLRTRSYTLCDSADKPCLEALIPGCDMLNTAEQGEKLNV